MIAQASLPSVSWVAIAPELALAIGAALVLLVDVQWKPRARVLGWVAGTMVVVAFGLAVWQKSEVADILTTGAADPAFLDRFTPFQGMLALDPGR